MDLLCAFRACICDTSISTKYVDDIIGLIARFADGNWPTSERARMRQSGNAARWQLFAVRLLDSHRYADHIAWHWCVLRLLQRLGKYIVGLLAWHTDELAARVAQPDHKFHNGNRIARQSIRNGLQWNAILADHSVDIHGDSGRHQNLLSNLLRFAIDQLLRILGHSIWQGYPRIWCRFVHHPDGFLYGRFGVRPSHRTVESNWTEYEARGVPHLSRMHFLLVAGWNESGRDCGYLSSNLVSEFDSHKLRPEVMIAKHFQAAVLAFSLALIVGLGYMFTGGFTEVFEKAEQGGRLEFWKYV